MSEEYETIKHVVQKNETLVGIALKYDMKVDQLKKLNRLYVNNTFEGQVLNVTVKKGSAPPPPPPSTQPQDVPTISLPSKQEPVSLLQLLSNTPSPILFPSIAINGPPSFATAKTSLTTSTSSLIPSLLAPSTPNKLKLSTSVPNKSFLDLMGVSLPIEQQTATTMTPSLQHKRSEVWDLAGITKPHEVVTCYAKYVPVHGMQITGVLTITPTRVIFEPNLDDPGVAKDGVLAHQFSVETGRLLEVEIFLDDVTFRQKLAKQLEDQAQWDVPRPKKTKAEKQRKNTEGKPEKPKKIKKSKSKIKTEDPIIHFDPTSEEMLQIVCSGRYRPKNYANFILPKEKGDVIYQRMVLFLSGSKEERLKAYLNLDVSTPSPSKKGTLRRQHSFSSTRDSDALDELKSKYDLSDTTVRPQIQPTVTIKQNSVAKKDRQQPSPKLKREKSKPEEKITQDIDATKKKKAEAEQAKLQAEQAKLLKEQQKKEKKAAKEAAKEAARESGKRRGSISDKWRSRKNSTVDTNIKSPPRSPRIGPITPTSTPPTSPLIISEHADSVFPAFDISDKSPTIPAARPLPLVDQAEEEAGFLPSLRDESLIFSTDDMHELRRYLPGYYKWMDWKLLYSTQNHGISFSTFLYRTKNVSPTLFVMEDSNGFVFGGFATAPWAINTSYFGTGQSFLFSLKPKVHVYEWTRANPFFMLMTPDAIAMGGDKEGRHGFRIDSNFEFGTSEVCSTYFNRCLASTERFKCTIVEVWTLTDSKIKI